MLIGTEGARLLREQRTDKEMHFVIGETPQALVRRGRFFHVSENNLPFQPAPRKSTSLFNEAFTKKEPMALI
jgi:hypothetical protein